MTLLKQYQCILVHNTIGREKEHKYYYPQKKTVRLRDCKIVKNVVVSFNTLLLQFTS